MKRPLPVILFLAVTSTACGDDASRADGPRSGSVSGETADPDGRPSASRVAAALALARQVELPPPEVRLDFGRLEVLHEAAGAAGFVESFEATARAESGDLFELDVRVVHRADPPSYHASLSRRTAGGRFDAIEQMIDQMRQQLPPGDTADVFGRIRASSPYGAPEREFVRIGDRYWGRGTDGWTGPFEPSVYSDLPDPTPIGALSRALDEALPPARRPPPLEEVRLHGRRATHFRIEDRNLFRHLWNAPDLGLPTVGSGDVPGSVDLWVQENGLILRAIFRLRKANGDEYDAIFEARDFGEQPAIEPPP